MTTGTIDDLLQWAEAHGHYVIKPLVENYMRYKEHQKENENETLRRRVDGDE